MQGDTILSFDVFSTLAQQYSRVGVYRVLKDKNVSPVSLLSALDAQGVKPCLLESNPKEKINSRYTTICFEPFIEIKAMNGVTTIAENDQIVTKHDDPFDICREYQKKLFAKNTHRLPGFIGGLVGFMSYDAIRLSEEIADRHDNVRNIPDLLFRSYQTNLVFDHQTGEIVITQLVYCKQDNHQETYEQACARLDEVVQQIDVTQSMNPTIAIDNNSIVSTPTVELDVDDETYCQMVKEAKKHIKQGDIFQVVLSREFSVNISGSPLSIYNALTKTNPSPYMFYFTFNDCAIAGSSPEILVNLKNGVITSRPLAGTRARDVERDDEVINDLLSDEKEIAEHMMLVDLARNDVGKVSKIGSVNVTKLKDIEKYTRVIHISSTVQGELSDNDDVFDVLKQAMPAGTLSGAPKIKAMDIIDRLEKSRRGVYGGAICAIDAEGNLDSCITIRTVLIQNNKAYVRAGGGLVLDSVPEMEAAETRHKARAIIEAILASQTVQEVS